MADGERKLPSGPPAEIPPAGNQEAFLTRWSRLKEEAVHSPPSQPAPEKGVDPKAPAPKLPPLEELTIDSDYRAFFHPKVDEDMRRAALKRLFSDPHFNVMDGLDVYIDDYSKTEPIPPAMLAGLKQAQNILAWAKEDKDARDKEQRDKERSPQVAANPTLEPPAASSPSEVGFEPSTPNAVPAAPYGAGERTGS